MPMNKLMFALFLYFLSGFSFSGQVILKADDFARGEGWQQFLNYTAVNELPINIGVVAKDFSDENKHVIDDLMKLVNSNSSNFSFFYHGHLHDCNKTNSLFTNGSKDDQQVTIIKDLSDLNSEGVITIAFGAPCNQNNAETAMALEAAGIRIWLLPYGSIDGFSGEVLRQRLNIESTAGKTDISEFFKKLDGFSYDADDVMIVQIHPGIWSSNDMSNFIRATEAIKNKGWNYRLLK
jgi:hypothetical protein